MILAEAPEITPIGIGLVVVAGIAAIAAAFVVTYLFVATVVVGAARLIRGRPDRDTAD